MIMKESKKGNTLPMIDKEMERREMKTMDGNTLPNEFHFGDFADPVDKFDLEIGTGITLKT